MQIPVQVTFRDIPVDDHIEAECLREARKLERYYDRITSCRVVVAQPHRHHRNGNQYDVRIDLTVPGAEIVINREPPQNHRDEEWHVALREAFDRARRRLEDHVHKMRGDVKKHDGEPG
jgi:ribosome-associated translation inhibitor RaiA